MRLFNTLFPLKLCHQTTWTAFECTREHFNRDGRICRSPCQNQIDYLSQSRHQKIVQNSRYYVGLSTSTDHKFVKVNTNLKSCKLKKHFKKSDIPDTDKLKNPKIRTKPVEEKQENETTGNTWNESLECLQKD